MSVTGRRQLRGRWAALGKFSKWLSLVTNSADLFKCGKLSCNVTCIKRIKLVIFRGILHNRKFFQKARFLHTDYYLFAKKFHPSKNIWTFIHTTDLAIHMATSLCATSSKLHKQMIGYLTNQAVELDQSGLILISVLSWPHADPSGWAVLHQP